MPYFLYCFLASECHDDDDYESPPLRMNGLFIYFSDDLTRHEIMHEISG